jgi:hypothetical protein
MGTLSELIQVLLAVAATPFLGVMLAFSVRRQRMAGTYRHYNLSILLLAWVLVTLASFYAACGPIGCSYGLRFGWVAELIPGISPQAAGKLTIISIIAYLLLCIYFIGHALGTVIWWVECAVRRM